MFRLRTAEKERKMSSDLTNKTMLCTAVIAAMVLAFFIHTDGHTSWLAAAWQAALTVIAAMAPVIVATLIISLIVDIPSYIANKKENHTRLKIEQCFPGTRATRLKSGKWLLTELSTGRTQCELDSDGAALVITG
jgi:hypothetical protein